MASASTATVLPLARTSLPRKSKVGAWSRDASSVAADVIGTAFAKKLFADVEACRVFPAPGGAVHKYGWGTDTTCNLCAGFCME